MRLRGSSLRWIALALLGLVIAAAVALAASNLASQQIGIASESVSAGDSLAPPITSRHRQQREDSSGAKAEPTQRHSGPGPSAEVVEPAPPTEVPSGGPPTSGEDDGGSGEGQDD